MMNDNVINKLCNIIKEEPSIYFTFKTLTHGRKESGGFGLSIPGNVCAEIIRLADYNDVFCSDIIEHMIRGMLRGDGKVDEYHEEKDGFYISFKCTWELVDILRVFEVFNNVPIHDIIRSCLINWLKRDKNNRNPYLIR